MGGDTMRGLGRSASALDSQVLGGRRAGLGFDVSGAAAGGLEWWQSLIKTGVETTGSILKSRYGQPPPGTYIQRTATGEVVYRTDPQAGGFQTIPPLGAGGTNLLMWGGIALGGVLLISMLKGR
jgi:hypothetical protein